MSIVLAASRVSDNLLGASDDSLSSALALIEELSLFNLMWSKGTDVLKKVDNKINHGTWSSNSDRFHEKLVAKSKQFAALSRGERLLMVIGELQKLMDVKPRDVHTRLDLSEVADDLCMAGVKILREDKKAGFTGSDIGAMIEFHMTKIFGGLRIRMDELSADQRQSLVDRVRGVLQSLPADQQRFIMEKLGASDLSESAIRQAIASGAMWTAFAAAVQIFGFAFYTTAAQLLAILSVHLLPFGAYVFFSSAIAVLSSAWMLPIFAGVGIWYYIWKNAVLRKSMAPLLVTILCLTGMDGTPADRESAVDEALALWETARSVRNQKRSDTVNAKSVRDRAHERLTATRTELSSARKRTQNASTERGKLDGQLARVVKSAVDNIANGGWGTSLRVAAAKVQQIENEIKQARQRRDGTSGIREKAAGYVKYGVKAIGLNSLLDSANDALVQEVKSTWPSQGTAYPPNAASLLREMEEKRSQILSAEGDIIRLTTQEREDSKKLDQACDELRRTESVQAESEKRYHGLGTV
jgi:hypothetical protein